MNIQITPLSLGPIAISERTHYTNVIWAYSHMWTYTDEHSQIEPEPYLNIQSITC